MRRQVSCIRPSRLFTEDFTGHYSSWEIQRLSVSFSNIVIRKFHHEILQRFLWPNQNNLDAWPFVHNFRYHDFQGQTAVGNTHINKTFVTLLRGNDILLRKLWLLITFKTRYFYSWRLVTLTSIDIDTIGELASLALPSSVHLFFIFMQIFEKNKLAKIIDWHPPRLEYPGSATRWTP